MDTNNPLTQSIAGQIRGHMRVKNIPVKELATKTGITVVSLSRYINGKRDIPSSAFALICHAIGLDSGNVLRNAIEEFTRVNAQSDGQGS